MRIGIPQELMPLPFMAWLKEQLSRHKEIEWHHKPTHKSKKIMLSEGDACHPFKSMVRTSIDLLPEIDTLLIPRLVKLDSHLMCPNFRALPDIVRLNINNICPEFAGKLNDITVDSSTSDEDNRVLIRLVKQLFAQNISAKNIVKKKQIPASLASKETTFPQKTIALLGHPYLLENNHLNMGITRQLSSLGYQITTPKDIPFKNLDALARKGDYYAKTNYWRSSREILGAFHYYTNIRKPAGIIYLIAFNCGVDALMRIELVSLHAKLPQTIPFMVLVGDEHTEQEHTATRLEAYLDIIDGI